MAEKKEWTPPEAWEGTTSGRSSAKRAGGVAYRGVWQCTLEEGEKDFIVATENAIVIVTSKGYEEWIGKSTYELLFWVNSNKGTSSCLEAKVIY